MTIQVDIKLASLADVGELHDLRNRVYNTLEDKSTFVCSGVAHIRDVICGNGFVLKVIDACGDIVGCLVCRYPGDAEDNYGHDIGLDAESLTRVVHMESCVISDAYQGQGLMGYLLDFAESLIDKHKYTYFMATASPDNYNSCAGLEKHGYISQCTKEKYGGLTRRVYLKRV